MKWRTDYMSIRTTGFAACFLTLALGLGACAGGNNGSATDNNRANVNQQSVKTQQTAPELARDTDANAIAQRLGKLATSVPGVKGANCVVFGNTAIVGIDVGGNLDRSRVGTIKYSVAEALRKDPDGANAIVTADMDLNSRIQEISADIRRGHPISGFAEELADIVGRIIPQLPRDTVERETPPPSPKASSQERGAHKMNDSANRTPNPNR
jgi:YhcN/YlaJ family sporulation lipoprotein